ncbi:MAG: hypothetical protein L0212_07810 [Acidobacteria bacterium]|nr:hypothetical protein [Acidobacteriota bacterium]
MTRLRFVLVVLLACPWVGAPSASNVGKSPCTRSEGECTFTATAYGVGSRNGEVLYRWELHYANADRSHWKSFFIAPDGTLAAEDDLIFTEAGFSTYRYVRHTSGERAEVRKEQGQVTYQQEWRNRKRRAQHSYSENFVTGPYVAAHVIRNWGRLRKSESLKVRFGVPDLLRSYEFRLSRDPSREPSSGDTVVIRMAPTSFLVGLFVDPVFLEFRDDGPILLRIVGRTLPVQRRGREIVPVDADLRIEWQDQSFRVR